MEFTRSGNNAKIYCADFNLCTRILYVTNEPWNLRVRRSIYFCIFSHFMERHIKHSNVLFTREHCLLRYVLVHGLRWLIRRTRFFCPFYLNSIFPKIASQKWRNFLILHFSILQKNVAKICTLKCKKRNYTNVLSSCDVSCITCTSLSHYSVSKRRENAQKKKRN